MGGQRHNGLVFQIDNFNMDSGTLIKQCSTSPGPNDLSESNYFLSMAIDTFKAGAMNFGDRFIQDAGVRVWYIEKTKQMAKTIAQEISQGQLTPFEGAKEANKLRNAIMGSARINSSDIGSAFSTSMKGEGATLSSLESRYAKKLFNQNFQSLSANQKNRVWAEIVEASARTRSSVNFKTSRLEKLGRSLIFLSIAVSVYNVTTAEDKSRQVVNEGATFGGGALGAAAGGGVAGLTCGPAAPVCVTIGVFIGGAVGALGADWAFDQIW